MHHMEYHIGYHTMFIGSSNLNASNCLTGSHHTWYYMGFRPCEESPWNRTRHRDCTAPVQWASLFSVAAAVVAAAAASAAASAAADWLTCTG